MNSVYDVLVEKFVGTREFEVLLGNEQSFRSYIYYLRESDMLDKANPHKRKCDVIDKPLAGWKAQISFGAAKNVKTGVNAAGALRHLS